MNAPLAQQIAAAAAHRAVEEGLEVGAARHLALRDWGGRRLRPGEAPDHLAIEDEVRAYLATFHADTQPSELRALRQLALRWMQRLAAHRPHLAGAVWRGTATRRSAILLDLYCDDPKSAEIELLNLGVAFDTGAGGGDGGGDGSDGESVLTFADRCESLNDMITLHLLIHDLDALRGALRPDRRGHSWRGGSAALGARLAEPEAPRGAPLARPAGPDPEPRP